MFVIDLTTYHLITADHKHTKGLPMAPLYIDQIKSLTRVFEFQLTKTITLKMAPAQVVETSVTNNSPSQDSNHPDDLFGSRYVTPGFKPFS